MAFNGSGTFSRLFSWATDLTNSVPVTASRMDSEMDGMATGLSTAICKDGQTTTTARIPFAAGLSVGDGSTATPSITFTSDTDTGIFRSAANTINIGAGGVSALSFTNTVITMGSAMGANFVGPVGFGAGNSTSTFVNITASTTAKSHLRLVAGVAPTAPVNGDIWFDGTNIKIQVAGSTKTFTIA